MLAVGFFPLHVCIWYVCAYSWVWMWVCTCHSVCLLEENCKYWCSPSTLFETGPLVIHYPCQAICAESIWEVSCSTTGTLWVIATCYHGQLCLGIESWTQVLVTAKQMLYQLNHLTKPYVSSLKVNFSFFDYVHEWESEFMCMGVKGLQTPEAIESSGAVFWKVVNCLFWVLGTKLRSM